MDHYFIYMMPDRVTKPTCKPFCNTNNLDYQGEGIVIVIRQT